MSTTFKPPLRSLVGRAGLIAPAMIVLLTALGLSGCLTVDRKEYLFVVKPDGTGSGIITFENVSSVQENESEADQLTKDYTQLVNDYVKGRKIESQNPAYLNVKKRLYEKNGKLYGELTFDFMSYEDVGLFRLDGKGMWMYHTGELNGASVETLDSTNGRYGGPKMPVIFWPEGTNEFRMQTSMERPDDNGVVRSLLPLFKRIGVQ